FFFQAEDGIRDFHVTGVQTCALPISHVFAAGLCVLQALGVLRTDTEALADALDREAERAHPGHELLVNPAKSMAMRMADRSVLRSEERRVGKEWRSRWSPGH